MIAMLCLPTAVSERTPALVAPPISVISVSQIPASPILKTPVRERPLIYARTRPQIFAADPLLMIVMDSSQTVVLVARPTLAYLTEQTYVLRLVPMLVSVRQPPTAARHQERILVH